MKKNNAKTQQLLEEIVRRYEKKHGRKIRVEELKLIVALVKFFKNLKN